jgi:hypothetical protein
VRLEVISGVGRRGTGARPVVWPGMAAALVARGLGLSGPAMVIDGGASIHV